MTSTILLIYSLIKGLFFYYMDTIIFEYDSKEYSHVYEYIELFKKLRLNFKITMW